MTTARKELPNAPATAGARALDGYQKRLLGFLSVATFFEGYDFFALTQVLPHLRRDFDLDHAAASQLLGVVNFGTVLAYLLVGRADRFGRKTILSVTILGYALFTALSGLAPNVQSFAICQLVARIFLIGEWATSMVIAAEEFPARRRGLVLGTIGAMAGLGSVLCVVVVPPLTAHFGWRSVYFVGIVPLLLLAFTRRGLRETERFQTSRQEATPTPCLGELWRSAYRPRVLQVGLVWFLTYLATQNAVSVWKDYAMTELGLTEAAASGTMTIAALAALPLSFLTGPFLDAVGRRIGATIILASTAFGILGSYSLSQGPLLTLALTASVFGVSAVLTALNAFTTELFPTRYRGSAFALCNNLLGRTGYWLSPFAVGMVAQQTGWGLPLRLSTVFPLLAILFVWLWLPETRGRELEQTGSLGK